MVLRPGNAGWAGTSDGVAARGFVNGRDLPRSGGRESTAGAHRSEVPARRQTRTRERLSARRQTRTRERLPQSFGLPYLLKVWKMTIFGNNYREGYRVTLSL